MTSVHVDVTEGIKILSCYALTPKGSTTGMLEISVVKKAIPLKFYCQECASNIQNTDIIILCGVCGSKVPLSDAFGGMDGGGLYCKEHAVECFGTEKIYAVSEIIDQIKIKEERR